MAVRIKVAAVVVGAVIAVHAAMLAQSVVATLNNRAAVIVAEHLRAEAFLPHVDALHNHVDALHHLLVPPNP